MKKRAQISYMLEEMVEKFAREKIDIGVWLGFSNPKLSALRGLLSWAKDRSDSELGMSLYVFMDEVRKKHKGIPNKATGQNELSLQSLVVERYLSVPSELHVQIPFPPSDDSPGRYELSNTVTLVVQRRRHPSGGLMRAPEPVSELLIRTHGVPLFPFSGDAVEGPLFTAKAILGLLGSLKLVEKGRIGLPATGAHGLKLRPVSDDEKKFPDVTPPVLSQEFIDFVRNARIKKVKGSQEISSLSLIQNAIRVFENESNDYSGKEFANACYWSFESKCQTGSHRKLLFSCIAIEALLGGTDGTGGGKGLRGITESIADRLALTLSELPGPQKSLREDAREIYKARGDVVHGRANISESFLNGVAEKSVSLLDRVLQKRFGAYLSCVSRDLQSKRDAFVSAQRQSESEVPE